MSFSGGFNIGGAGINNPEFALEVVDQDAAAARVADAYGTETSDAARPAVEPPTQQEGVNVVPGSQPDGTADAESELLRALQQGGNAAEAIRRYQLRSAAPSPAAAGAGGHQQLQAVQQAPLTTVAVHGQHANVAVGGGLAATNARADLSPLAPGIAPPPQQQAPRGEGDRHVQFQPPEEPAAQQQHQQQGVAPPSATYRPGSLAAAAAAFAPECKTPEFINGELAMQRESGASNTAKDSFRDNVLASMSITCGVFWYVASREKSTTLELLHSPTRYCHPTVARSLNSAMLAFIGDRTPMMTPTCVKLQQQKAFGWSDVQAVTDRTLISAFYDDAANRNSFFPVAQGMETTTKAFPNMCLLPLSVVPWAAEAPRTLDDARRHIEQLAIAQPDVQWTPILEWIAAASQDDSTGNGRITVDHAPVRNTEEEFHKWKAAHLESTLGKLTPDSPSAIGEGGLGSMAPIAQHLTATLATTANTLQVIQQQQSTNANTAAAAAASASTSTTSGGKGFDEYMLTALCAFCRVTHPRFLPPIWLVFNSTTNVQTQAAAFADAMKTFASANRIEIEENLFFPDDWMKRIVKTEFSSGMVRAGYSTLGYGVDMMPFLGRSLEDIQVMKRRQAAALKTQATRTLDEQERLETVESCPPPSNYADLVRAWRTTFVGLRVLFGQDCPLTINFRDGLAILESDGVKAGKQDFDRKPRLCRELVFHACCDMSYFFSQRKTPGFFRGSAQKYPVSLLRELYRHIQWQTPVNRSNFPGQWEVSSGNAAGGTDVSVQNLIQSAVAAQTQALRGQLAALQSAITSSPAPAGQSTGSPPIDGDRKRPAVKREPFHLTEIHPNLAEHLRAYHNKFDGRVLWKSIKEHGNFTVQQLPVLQRHVDAQGRNNICWTDFLGRCTTPNCAFSHVPTSEVDAQFVTAALAILRPGIDYVTANVEPYSDSQRKKMRKSRGRGGGAAGSGSR